MLKDRDPSMVAMGKRMKQAAEDAGLKRKEIAASMSTSHTSVSRWFNGDHTQFKRPRMKEFAEVVGADEGWLWTGERGGEHGPCPTCEHLKRAIRNLCQLAAD